MPMTSTVCSGGVILPARRFNPAGRTTPLPQSVVRSVQIEEPSGFVVVNLERPPTGARLHIQVVGKETHMTLRTGIIVGLVGVASLVGGATVRAQSDGMRAVIP